EHGANLLRFHLGVPPERLLDLCDRYAGIKWTPRRILNAIEWRIFKKKIIWCAKAFRKAESILQHKQIDVVLSTWGPIYPHLIVLKLKKRGFRFFWVADIRDEISTYPSLSERNRRRLLPFERKVITDADLITSISKPILDDLRRDCTIDKFLEVRNGYDYEEYHDVNFQPQFTMAYLGNLYLPYITPYKFIHAFADLLRKGQLPANSVFKIIGSLYKDKVPDELSANVKYYDPVSHDEAIRISCTECDVLVMIHASGRKGVYSGKVFDYLATNKPILALYDPNDVVGDLLAKTKSGIVVDEDDYEGIKSSILQCYGIWKNHEVLPRNWEEIRLCSRQYQAMILIKKIESCLENYHCFDNSPD
ncbi:hypothetical protein, partial [Alistipes senegalensis]|uniref:hypothetical protein n=1 Tax=Alistipes senegalensis TaxID=1288121 RepID=UPI0018AA8AEC